MRLRTLLRLSLLATVLLASWPVWAEDVSSEALQSELAPLQRSLADLRGKRPQDFADAAIFAKGLQWALDYDRDFKPEDRSLLKSALERAGQRVAALVAGQQLWSTRRGKLALGYVSQVDGSVQPYGLIVPKGYHPDTPIRLDVVLHGSSKPVGLSELRFIARFDEGDEENGAPPEQPFIELHPLGRVENCYRWAGETDVFEAIADVCRRYNIDRGRIVLRGMSMGASGTWHLGLKHPDRFVALGPYCGYVDTHRFSQTPLPNFVKVGKLPEHQERGLHMLDSVDYAANAGIIPAIACMGEKDVFFDAHVIMGQAMEREGLKMVNLISPGTGHVIDPTTHAEQMRQIGELADKGLDESPRALRFVTWTLKYSRCHWLQLLGLESHYDRAEIIGQLRDGSMEISKAANITRFAVLPARLPAIPKAIVVEGAELPWPGSITSDSPGVVVAKTGGKWSIAGELGRTPLDGKRPGLQGPIDDAFTSRFVCVRGTGKPWNAAVQAYADASLKRFAQEWRQYFRGDLPIKDDTAVTDEDIKTCNLILFGDPGSNRWIAKSLPKLPLAWSPQKLTLGGREYDSANHAPALIAPNPLPGGEQHYVVLNSGHTFREAELASLNYLLFPRWGDWAALQIDPPSAGQTVPEKVVQAGYFDEQWK